MNNIGSRNSVLPDGTKPLIETMLTYCQIIWQFLWNGLLGTNLSEIWIANPKFSFKKMNLKYCLQNIINFFRPQYVNSLWLIEAAWHRRTCLIFVQLMPCCLAAPNHYLNQWWLIISEVFRHSPEGKLQEILKISHYCLIGKLWFLQHSCVGDTIAYHWDSDLIV